MRREGSGRFSRLWTLVFLAVSLPSARAATKPVPASCTPAVNAGMVQFIQQQQASGSEGDQDNVMVCGTALRNALPQHAGHSGAGAHHLLVLSVPTANGTITIEVVTNDQLDGVVTAHTGDAVFAYGQAFYDLRPLRIAGLTAVAGLHEPHCATHAGADDGWVVVAGKRYPAQGCGEQRR